MAAPLAQFDEDWQDFNEFQPFSEGQGRLDEVNSNNVGDAAGLLDDFSELDNSFSGDGSSFRSVEDLVKDFEEKLAVCFRSCGGARTENVAPVVPITEESMLKDDEIWNALTDNYGNVMPVDWKTSHTRSLHLPTLNLMEKGKPENANLDLSDDEELREQLDMHSIIVSCINDEPLFTAEQVIEEIEEMMQESPDPEELEVPSQSDLSLLSQEMHTLQRSCTSSSYEERLKHLSVAELNELLEEVEADIRQHSEELIQQLALRDELDFEKEVKNSFISVLIDVQNKQKEHRELLKKRKKLRSGGAQQGRPERTHAPGTRFSMESFSTAIQNGFRNTFGSSGGDKQYLTTVIPYEKKGGPPSVEDLQILTKILQAMREDSDKVPSLLTDYILKGNFFSQLLGILL
ncbi:fasciculation and elongation protein zeta-2 isoform X1 [Scleropages formosus]|uniref:fasciculation and elongation protein zeta-2 isoform X1 n=1 Tax=Scleropages formosus TaxID=113540 RepID=UPI00087880D9|nr:fasciculation and elongation protein zeta-2 isoform X1 [Scleropages formosus]